jgi:long-chain acyl-CoA synthetase
MPFISGKTVTEIFLKRAKATPHLIGFEYKLTQGPAQGQWRKISFREFFVDVKAASYGLLQLGVKAGDRVAILSNTRYEWSLMDMAVLGAKAVTVAIYPSSTPEDISTILNNSEAKYLVIENEKHLEKIKALAHLEKIILIDSPTAEKDLLTLAQLKELGRVEELKNPQIFENNLVGAQPSDLIAIAYTSGTTGVPRGAMLTHDNMVSVLEDSLAIFFNFSEPESEVVLSFLPFSHIFGKVESLAVHVFGWRQAFAEDLDKLLLYMKEIKPTMLLCVPRTFEKAYERIQERLDQSSYPTKKLFHWGMAVGKRYYAAVNQKRFPKARDFAEYHLARKLVFSKITDAFGGKLRFAICGGAPLQKELGEFFQIAGVKILEGYGLTETCGPVTVNTPDEPHFGTVGKPMAEVSLRIAEDGEIEIKSRKVFKDYYPPGSKAPAEIQDGWFKTGDIGSIDDEGFLSITNRKKDLIVTSGGKNIAPQKIEALSVSQPLIHQMVVLGDRRPYLVALLTLNREKIIRLASDKKILFSEYAQLIHNPKVIALVQQSVDEINEHLTKYETIKKFAILPQDFNIENGELTPSLKLKRRVVEARHEAQIEALYSSKEPTRLAP